MVPGPIILFLVDISEFFLFADCSLSTLGKLLFVHFPVLSFENRSENQSRDNGAHDSHTLDCTCHPISGSLVVGIYVACDDIPERGISCECVVATPQDSPKLRKHINHCNCRRTLWCGPRNAVGNPAHNETETNSGLLIGCLPSQIAVESDIHRTSYQKQ